LAFCNALDKDELNRSVDGRIAEIAALKVVPAEGDTFYVSYSVTCNDVLQFTRGKCLSVHFSENDSVF